MEGHVKAFKEDSGYVKALLANFGSVVVFIFHAQWNEQSNKFLQNFTNSIEIFGQYDNVKYFSFAAQICPWIFEKFNVEKTPTVIFTQTDKKVLYRSESNDIGSMFQELEKISSEHKIQFEKDRTIWYPKIQNILDSCPVIVFIKGTPSEPKCGFSETLLQILKNHEIQYTYYDIIEDQYMRYWLKEYKKWPSFPQLYINGKLIGGLDKIKDHVAKGELKGMFPESSRKKKAQQRYSDYLKENKVIVFVDGFPFENKNSDIAINEAKEKHENVFIYNVKVDEGMKEYIGQKLNLKLPFVVKEGKIE